MFAFQCSSEKVGRDGYCHDPFCGDDMKEWSEACDDGEKSGNSMVCTERCNLAKCGDGLVWAGVEDCDDGDGVDGLIGGNNCDSTLYLSRLWQWGSRSR